MQIVIDIPETEVPKKQEMVMCWLHFIDGHVCECTYPFQESAERKGNWLVIGGKCTKMIDKRIVECSVCGNTLSLIGVNAGRGDANFCPNCGAAMREGK